MADLKYLFQVEYYDGHTYKQNRLDHSIKFPPIKDEKGNWQGKNCWTDIKEDIAKGLIKKFSVVENTKIFPKTYSVYLTDGHFEINGEPLSIEAEERVPQSNTLPTLIAIYYRDVRKDIEVSFSLKTGDIVKAKEVGQLPDEYVLGWQCIVDGKNYQRKIRFH